MSQTNEEILAQLVGKQKSAYEALANTISKIKKNHHDNPDMDMRVLDSFESHWLKTELAQKNNADKLIRANKPPAEIAKSNYDIKQTANAKWEAAAKKEFGLKGAATMQALNSDQNPGFVGSITRNFYDKNDGGLQAGGVMGAVAGVALASMLIPGGMAGAFASWTNIALVIGGLLIGGFAGNKGGDLVKGLFSKKEVPAPAPSQGVAQQQSAEASISEVERMQEAQRWAEQEARPALPAAEHIEPKESGQLPAGTTATGTPTTQKENERQ